MNQYPPESGSSPGDVNYDEAAVTELLIDELEYRIDAGKEGTALCVSTRVPGTWDWSFAGEIRFDGTDVRSKVLERPIRDQLSRALRLAVEASSDV